jgi:two-component system OmpR family response regulator
MTGHRLLVVDDDDNLRSMLSAALRHYGFDVDVAADGSEALGRIQAEKPDLVVLDVMMPGLDGFEVCRLIRSKGDLTPVLFLTARGDTADKVTGLKAGGDDYLEKPFSLDELTARIEAILRRTQDSPPGNVLTLADLSLDEDAHVVTRDGVSVHLSPTEYRLLRYLLINRGRVVSKAQIMASVWDYDFDGDGGVVETYIGYLRRKLDNSEPKLIHTVRGFGYTMRVQR